MIDTPGFEAHQPSHIKTLTRISELQRNTGVNPLTITGAIYFHRITDGKLSGSLRDILEVCKQLCGDDFFPRVAFVTTMWAILNKPARVRYEKFNAELDRKYLRFCEQGPDIFKFYNDEPTCSAVVKHFSKLATSSDRKRDQLLLFKELSSAGSSVRRTAAGRTAQKPRREKGQCIIL